MNKVTLYQATRLGKIQKWEIWVEEKGESGHPEVFTLFGLDDGKKQITHDIISEGVNVGKANETTPLQQAILTLERKVVKQKECGYSEQLPQVQTSSEIDFSQPLPKQLCFYKPKNSIDEKKLQKLEQSGKVIYTVKRDGQMAVVRSCDAGLEIYSRRMDLITNKFPHIQSALDNLPKQTILLGEMILDQEGKDNFRLVSGICRSDPEESLAKQNLYGKVSYYIFDVAFLNGKNLLTTTPFKERRVIMSDLVASLPVNENSKYIIPCEVVNKKHVAAMEEIKERKLEGLVVWDGEGLMEKNEWATMNGKAYRPNIIFKSKPKYEDDFIVKFDPEKNLGKYGNGKNNGKIKSAALFQIEDGKEVFLGNCGGGLTDKQRDFYTDTTKYPRVWKVEYDSIQPKSGSLRFPVFKADRTLIGDKNIEECEMSEAIKAARETEDEGDEE